VSASSSAVPVLKADPLPLHMDGHGAIRVRDSRITLDVLVDDFESGASPDEIAQSYDTLDRADVYIALAYYLHHKEELLAYFKRREEEASEIERKLVEAGMSWPEAGNVLRARMRASEIKPDASTIE
jgi:uncharacterized protein (DUF433 family)